MKSTPKSKSRANEGFPCCDGAALIKPVKLLIALLLVACSAFGQTHVYFPLAEFNASPATNRIVEVQALTPFKGNAVSYNTGTNEFFYLSNAIAADYGVTIKQRGNASAIQFQITVLSTNLGVIGAYTNTSVSGVQTHPTSGKAAWSILASDARYVPYGTAGVSIAAGTNATATTNGNLVTISAVPSDSANALTNSDTRTIHFPGFQMILGTNTSENTITPSSGLVTFSQSIRANGSHIQGQTFYGTNFVATSGGFVGDGSGLTNLTVGASLDPRFSSSSGTTTAASNTFSATTLSATTVNASVLNGNGAGLTALNASQLASGTVPTARLDSQLQNFVSSDSVRAASGSLEVGGQTSSDTVDFIGSLRGKGTLLTNSYGVFLAPTNAGTVGQVPTLTADGVNMAFASVAGIGDLQAVNNLADVSSAGQSRTNLSAHNADNLTRGTIPLARLTSLPLSQVTNAGTAAYSNTSAFVLSPTNTGSDGQLVSLTGNKTKWLDAGSGIPTMNGSGTNTILYFKNALFGTNQQISSAANNISNSAILSGSGNSLLIMSSGNSYMNGSVIVGGNSNTINAAESQEEGITIGGGIANYIFATSSIVTIGGGRGNAVGMSLINNSRGSTVSGGLSNRIGTIGDASAYSVISGGASNVANSPFAVVSGGSQNAIQVTNSDFGVIIGGLSNTISTGSPYSVVLGGAMNTVSGTNAIAAGRGASATNSGSVVFNDYRGVAFGSTSNNQFLLNFQNGVGINTNNPGTNALSVRGNVESSVGFTVNGVPVGGGTTYTNSTGLPGVVLGSGIGTNLSTLATQSSLAAGIVPIRTTNDFAVTISSRGIANGQSSISNNGAMYGIDTPSTTTCGIQEAINAWDRGTNYGPTISTLSLEFGPGIFFYSNVITLSNLYTSAITWRGQSQLGTTWAYAGATTVTNTITVTGGDNTNGSSLDIPIHLTVRDGTFTALTNSTNVLLYIDHVSATYLENLNFTGWNVRTNQETGSGVSMYPTASLFAPGLVGLRINQEYDHNFTMDNIFFAGLAVGARVKSDHVVARNLKFAMISYGSYGSTNVWHTNSIYSIGAGIIQEGSSYDSSWHYGHCYAMRAGFAGVGQLHYPKLLNWHFESIQFPILSDSEYVPTLIEPAATSESMAFIDQYQLFTPTSANYPTNGYCPTTIPAIGAFAYGSGKWDSVTYAMYVRLANNLVFVVDGASGALSADASGMTGIPAAALADGTTGSGTFARSSSPAFTTKITVGTPSVTSGSGAPSANEPIGSLYMRTDGSTSTSLYVKTASGAGAGNWTAK